MSIKLNDDLSTSINHKLLGYRESDNAFSGVNKFGSPTSYIQINRYGQLSIFGPAILLKKQYLDGHSLRNGSPPPTFTAFQDGVFANSFVDSAINEAHGSFEIQSDYKNSSNLEIILHWSPSTTNVGDCRWSFEYTIANMTTGTFGSTTPLTVNAPSGGTAFKHNVISLGTISGTDLTKGAILMFKISRQGTHTDDSFTGDSFLLRIDLQYQADKL